MAHNSAHNSGEDGSRFAVVPASLNAEQPGTLSEAAASGRNDRGIEYARTSALMDQLLSTLNEEFTTAKGDAMAPKSSYYISIARRQWLALLLVFVASLALAVWKMPRTPRQYVSMVTVLLPKPPDAVQTTPTATDTSYQTSQNRDIYTEVAILTSPEIMHLAWQQTPADVRKAGWLDGTPEQVPVIAKPEPDTTDLIDVSIYAYDPRASEILANTIAAVYAQHTRDIDDKARQENIVFTAHKLKDAQALLDQAKQDLQHYKEATGHFDVAGELMASSQRIASLQQQAELARIDAETGASGVTSNGDSVLPTLQQHAMDARTKYELVLRDYFPDSPKAKAAKADLDSALKLLDARRNAVAGVARTRETSAETDLAKLRLAAAALPAAENRMGQLTTRVTLLQNTYSAISDRYTSLLLTSSARIATPSVLRSADSGVPAADMRKLFVALAAVLSFGIAALVAFVLELLDKSVHSPEDLRKFNVPMLGAVPYLGNSVDQRLSPINSAQPGNSALLEACCNLRSNLYASLARIDARSLLVTSTSPGEGKSFCALNIATSMAYGGSRVILLDFSLKNPAQHIFCEQPLVPGLSNILAGELSPESAIQSTPVTNLSLLTAGHPPPTSLQVLGEPRTRKMLEDLKTNYDVVVIDSAPAATTADAQILSSLADGVVLVVADATRDAEVQRAQAVLRLTGAHLLGVVLNKQKYHTPVGKQEQAFESEVPPQYKSLPPVSHRELQPGSVP